MERLVPSGIPTASVGIETASGVRVVVPVVASVARTAAVASRLGGVEKVVEDRGTGVRRGGPVGLGRIRAHAGGMVDRLTDHAFEEFVRPAGTVIRRDEDDLANDGAPFGEGYLVDCGGEDINVPCRVRPPFTRAYVLLLNEVEAAHYDRVAQVAEDNFNVLNYGGSVVAKFRDESSDRFRGFGASGR